MGQQIELVAADGHRLSAYRADPAGVPRAGLVVLQEIFGVTAHIQRVADGFAAEGFRVVAPALVDRVAKGIVYDYSDIERGRETMLKLELDDVVADVAAAVGAVRDAGRVGAVGYCWGGAIADLAACRAGIDAAVSYYGGRTTAWLDLQPGCPVLYHFGARDPLIPPETVEQIRAGRPAGTFYVYPDAGHGFNCDEREDYHPESARLARERSLAHFSRWLG